MRFLILVAFINQLEWSVPQVEAASALVRGYRAFGYRTFPKEQSGKLVEDILAIGLGTSP